MKVAIIGAGSIGTRHASLLSARVGVELLVADPDAERGRTLSERFEGRQFLSVEDCLNESPDAAFICSPTSMHVAHALAAVRAGCHVFVEKPLGRDLEGIDELEAEVQRRGRVGFVACNFRFDPPMLQLKRWLDAGVIGRPLVSHATYGQYLPSCRPGRDYRNVYAAHQDLGGGILLESVHEIDYLRWLFGEVDSVAAMQGRLGDLDIDCEDTVNILLRFRFGVLATVHLDYVRPHYDRSCEIVGNQGILEWRYQARTVRYTSQNSAALCDSPEAASTSPDTMYDVQLTHFLDCIGGKAHPAQSITDAARVMRVITAVRLAAETRKDVLISQDLPISPTAKPASSAAVPSKPIRTVAIIQARMSSTRLPGKVLANIKGKSMIEHVVERTRAAGLVDEVLVSTSVNSADDPLAKLCAEMGVRFYRGSEVDVLDRYYRSAQFAQADAIVRVTGDCPLIDPAVIDKVILAFFQSGADYASNRIYVGQQILYTYPDGLDAEVFSFRALSRAWEQAERPSEREHVTSYMWSNPGLFRLATVEHQCNLSHLRWSVDEPDDLECIRQICERLPETSYSMEAVLAVLDRAPHLARINSNIPLNAGYMKAIAMDEGK